MHLEAILRNQRASILARSVQWSVGRLLADRTRAGEVVPLDPDTGGEISDKVDDRPAFILSTEGEATDGHICRQFWDLSRAEAGIAPILHNHDADRDLGLWQDAGVRSLDVGPALVARAFFDMEDPAAVRMRGKVRRGFIKSTSVGWIPGAPVRRGSLKETDDNWRPMRDDECGQPAEGFVMGTEAEPNIFVEGSLTPIPADARALGLERVYGRGTRALARAVSGEAIRGGDLDSLLALLASEPRVRAWAERLVDGRLAHRDAHPTTTPAGRSVAQLLSSS